MDIKQVEYVLEIAQSESISKAATRLYLSQPALTQQVKKLETELGYALFYRTPQGVELTVEGREFCREAESAVREWRRFSGRVLPGVRQRRLRLGLGTRVYSSGLFESIVSFFDLHQDLEASFASEAGRDFLPALRDGSLDVVIDRLPPNELQPEYRELFLYDLIREKQCVLMPWDDPRCEWKKISFSDLQGSVMISALENSMEDKTLKATCFRHGITLKRLYRADNIDTVMELVRRGKGVVIGPRSFGKYYGVAAVPLVPEMEVSLMFLCQKSKLEEENVVQFLEYLQEVCEKKERFLIPE